MMPRPKRGHLQQVPEGGSGGNSGTCCASGSARRGPQLRPDARHVAILPTESIEGVGMSHMTLPPCSSRGLDARCEENEKRALR